ncbi:MAG: hypothetical protein P4M11_04500 [Candidatus Pacebacteria bacterium]|nr:hypothetical protein [Candidatus Paceibacterota bacterium]
MLTVQTGFFKAFVFNPQLRFDDPTACFSPIPALAFHVVRSGILLIQVYSPVVLHGDVSHI